MSRHQGPSDSLRMWFLYLLPLHPISSLLGLHILILPLGMLGAVTLSGTFSKPESSLPACDPGADRSFVSGAMRGAAAGGQGGAPSGPQLGSCDDLPTSPRLRAPACHSPSKAWSAPDPRGSWLPPVSVPSVGQWLLSAPPFSAWQSFVFFSVPVTAP